MITFDPSAGFEVTEIPDLREQVAGEWREAFKEDGRPPLNTAPETPQGQIIDSQVAAIAQKDAEVLYIAQQFDPRVAEGKFQDALAQVYFLKRKPAINSSATLTLTGASGTQIAAGALVQSEEDGTRWALAEDVVIPGSGSVATVFTCQEAGAVEAAAGTLTRIVTTVAGWDMATNPEAATVGQLEESQAAFEERRYNSVALNSRGTVGSVFSRVAALDGVIAAYVTDNRTSSPVEVDGYALPPHSVFVAALGGDDDGIAAAIYNSLSAGCDMSGNTAVAVTDPSTGAVNTVRFHRPSEWPVFVRVTIQDTGSLPSGYEDTIREAVRANFYGEDTATKISGQALLRIRMNDDIYSSRFTPSILNAGIANVLSVELSTDGAAWASVLHVPIWASPSLLAANITVEVE